MQAPAEKRVAESACLLLIQEMVALTDRTVADQSAGLNDEAVIIAAHIKLEEMGFSVGYRFIERISSVRLVPAEPLEAIKFICKDFWQEIFGKSIDKLQTNHRGVFVLKDSAFKWTSKHSFKSDLAAKTSLMKFLKYACGLLRGALLNLGYTATVKADFDAVDLKQVQFNVCLVGLGQLS